MKLNVGASTLRGSLGRYSSRFNLLEVRAEPGRIPRPGKLKTWTSDVPEGFVFSLVLPRTVAELGQGPERDKALAQAIASLRSLDASWMVLQTPPMVTPSSRSRARLQALSLELSDKLAAEDASGTMIAWEPRGLWDGEEAEVVANALGWHLVRDLSREEAPVAARAYTRLRALGEASRLREGDLEQVADQLAGCDEACIVIEGDDAALAARRLRGLLADDDRDDVDDDDDEGEDLDDDDDDLTDPAETP